MMWRMVRERKRVDDYEENGPVCHFFHGNPPIGRPRYIAQPFWIRKVTGAMLLFTSIVKPKYSRMKIKFRTCLRAAPT